MPVFEIDARFPDHRKLRKIPQKDRVPAAGLWSLAGAWSTAHVPGFMPADVIEEKRWDPRFRLSGLLVEVALWHPDELKGEQGYTFHDWIDWRPVDDLDVDELDDEDIKGLPPADRKRVRARLRKRRERERETVPTGVDPAPDVTPESVTVTRDMGVTVTRDVTRDTPSLPSPHTPHLSHPTHPFGVSTRAAAAARGPAHASARESDPPSREAETAVRTWLPPGISARTRFDLGKLADQAVSNGASWHAVEQAILAWRSRSDARVGLFPNLVDDAVRAEHGATEGRPVAPPRSTTDDRVAAVEALRHTGTDTPPSGLRAITGGRP